jgi:hypothetical protein
MSIWVGGEGWVAFGHDNAKVEVAEKVAKREKRERIVGWGRKNQGRLIFCQLWTQISSPSDHEIHLYL